MLNKYHASEKWKKKEELDADPVWKGEAKLLDHEKEYKRLLYESEKERKLMETHL